MTQVNQSQLERATEMTEDDLHDEIRVIADYSGKGMMGRQCIAVVGDFSVATSFLLNLAILRCDDSGEANINEVRQELAEITVHTKTDMLGMSGIYYWPYLNVQTDDIEMEG